MQRWPLYFLFVFTLLMLLFTLSRIAFYFLFITTDVPSQVFTLGFDFDIMAASYLCLPPFLIFILTMLVSERKKNILRIVIHALTVFTCLSVILLLIADLPWFDFFHSRITTSALLWVQDFGQSLRFIFSVNKFLPFMIVLILLSALIVFLLGKVRNKYLIVPGKNQLRITIPVLLVFSAILFYGMRGTRVKRPPGMKDAFFSNNGTFNQMSLNPVFTWFDSFSLFKINFFEDDSLAIHTARQQLEINDSSGNFPIARKEFNESKSQKPNIILILMEGMSMDMTGLIPGGRNLTPFLDSLADENLFFSQCYSAGIHTCNGVFAALYGMPALMAKHPFADISSQSLHFYGLPQLLKEHGYYNSYFIAHYEEFDNNGYFLPRNGIDKIYSQKDYPASETENVWGVSDEFLLSFALQNIDSLSRIKQPFFSTILTISTHPPQSMPSHTAFKASANDVIDQVYQYADYALAEFFNMAKSKSWYKNTLFILAGDHGINLPSVYEAPLSHNHIPLIAITADTMYSHTRIDYPVMQTDIVPLTMQLAGFSFLNYTLAANPLHSPRPYIYFSQDNRLCIMDSRLLLVINKYGSEVMYNLSSGKSTNILQSHQADALRMKQYAYAMLQTLQWMISEKKTGIGK